MGATQVSVHAVHVDSVLPGDEEIPPVRPHGRWLTVEVRVTAPTGRAVKWAQIYLSGYRLRARGEVVLPNGGATTQAQYEYGTSEDVEIPAGETEIRPLTYDVSPRIHHAVRAGGATIEFITVVTCIRGRCTIR